MYETILVEDADAIGIVTLNRPERMNAWTRQMGREIRAAIDSLDSREDIRAIVVTGAGSAFCAGADVGAEPRAAAAAEDANPSTPRVASAPAPFWAMHTPIIAAMNGAAVGVGLTMALQWDLRIVAEEGKYGFVFSRRGFTPERGSTWLLPRLIGLARASDLLLTGRIFRGVEAVELGIASLAVPAEDVLPRARAVAYDIARNVAPVSAAVTKRLINEFLSEPDRAGAEVFEDAVFAWAADQPDAHEGISAFLSRRVPEWSQSKYADFPDQLFGDRGTPS